MPTVRYGERTVECDAGAVLRDVLLDAGIVPHNGRAATVNCRGNGTCGTCAVAVAGETNDPTRRERWRLDFPPHEDGPGPVGEGGGTSLRLACQTRVGGDLVVEKYPGFWGQHTDREPVSDEGDDSTSG